MPQEKNRNIYYRSARLYSIAQDYIRFAQMLANGGTLDSVQILARTSVKLMTSNLLPEGVPTGTSKHPR